MTKIDLFVEKNYDLIKKNYFDEARALGYEKSQYQSYFEDCKCFTFVGTFDELKQIIKSPRDYHIIASDDDLVIAEMFNGKMFNFI